MTYKERRNLTSEKLEKKSRKTDEEAYICIMKYAIREWNGFAMCKWLGLTEPAITAYGVAMQRIKDGMERNVASPSDLIGGAPCKFPPSAGLRKLTISARGRISLWLTTTPTNRGGASTACGVNL